MIQAINNPKLYWHEKKSWVNNILSLDRQYKPRNYFKNVTFTLLNTNKGNWKWFRLETILNNIVMKKASWVNYVKSLDRQYKPKNYLKNVTFTLLNTNTGNWKWLRLELILNNIDMKKATWFNHILSLDSEYKPRNYLKNVTFSILNMNRGNWKWFRLKTIIINIDMKKASWFIHILSLDRDYKPRNYFKNVTLNLLNMNRGNWKWFTLETILNNIVMKKASWVNYVKSLDRQYKPKNYLKNVTFTLLDTNRGNWKWFRLEKILINNKMKKHRDIPHYKLG